MGTWVASMSWLLQVVQFRSVQVSSVAQSCPTLCNPTGCSTPGFPVHHKLPELAKTHIHWVGDAINHLILCRPLLLLPPIFPSIRVFSSESVLPIRWPEVLEFQLQHQSFQWIFRTDFLQEGLIGSPCSPRDSQASSPTPQFKSINFSTVSFLYSPTLMRLGLNYFIVLLWILRCMSALEI